MKSQRKKFKVLGLFLGLVLPSFSLLGDLSNGLVAWYPFDGNASDMSGNGNHGTVYGATLAQIAMDRLERHTILMEWMIIFKLRNLVNSQYRIKLRFRFGSNFGTGKQVTEISFKKEIQVPVGISLWTGNGMHLSFIHLANGLDYHIGSIHSDQKVGLNKFSNLAMVFNASNFLKLYLDGKLVGNSTSFNSSFVGGVSPLFIGARKGWAGHDDPSRPFNGSIDDIRIYDRALSAEEVSSLYRLESPNHFAEMNSTMDLEMIWVEPGTFTMGQTGVSRSRAQCNLDQRILLGKYEVTQAQYEAVMTGNDGGYNSTPSNFSGNFGPSGRKVFHGMMFRF